MAEPLELADQPARVGLGGVPEQQVILPELGVRLTPLQHVVGDDEDRVPDGDHRPLVAAPSLEPGVLC